MKVITTKQPAILIGILAITLGCMRCTEVLLSNDDSCPNTCDAHTIIIGCDDRIVRPNTINSLTDEPWSYIGNFQLENDGGGCSGTLIGGRFVLTAAHCALASWNNAQKPLEFALAQETQAVRPFGTSCVRRVFVPGPFNGTDSEEDRVYDYAIAELWEPIAGASPAQWGYVSWDILRYKPVFTAGYPGTQPDHGFLGRPWITEGKYASNQPFSWINGGDSGLLYTDLDGSGGQSGSPVYSFLTPSQHEGQDVIRKVTGVLIGSPVAACLADQDWVAYLTPGAVAHIENVINGTEDNWWQVTEFPRCSTTSGPGGVPGSSAND